MHKYMQALEEVEDINSIWSIQRKMLRFIQVNLQTQPKLNCSSQIGHLQATD